MKRFLPLLLVVILFSFIASVDLDDQGGGASALLWLLGVLYLLPAT